MSDSGETQVTSSGAYYAGRLREVLAGYEPSRERKMAEAKLDSLEMWLARCELAARERRRLADLESLGAYGCLACGSGGS